MQKYLPIILFILPTFSFLHVQSQGQRYPFYKGATEEKLVQSHRAAAGFPVNFFEGEGDPPPPPHNQSPKEEEDGNVYGGPGELFHQKVETIEDIRRQRRPAESFDVDDGKAEYENKDEQGDFEDTLEGDFEDTLEGDYEDALKEDIKLVKEGSPPTNIPALIKQQEENPLNFLNLAGTDFQPGRMVNIFFGLMIIIFMIVIHGYILWIIGIAYLPGTRALNDWQVDTDLMFQVLERVLDAIEFWKDKQIRQ